MCSMMECGGTDQQNKFGLPEEMITCHVCGQSGHPSCLEMTDPDMVEFVKGYDWECIDCKTCQECGSKGEEVSIPSSGKGSRADQ